MPSRSRHALRAIFLDAGNTLLRMNYPAIAGALAARGHPVSPDDVQRAEWRARVRLDTEVLAPAAGRVSTESRATGSRYVALILDELGVRSPEVAASIDAWRASFNRPFGLFTLAEPAAAPALRLAREAGVATAVISNSNGTVRSVLEGLGIAPHVDFVLDSAEEGVEKPDPRIFARALERAAVRADEAAYVGDLYSIDVLGARRAGLRSVLLDPGGHWGERDCPVAPDVLAAVTLLLGGR